MHLYMIRHGQSYVNLPDWDGGNQDKGLTKLGKQQAKALAAWLPADLAAVDVIYCSTMKRARETVAPLSAAYDLPVTYDDRIREVGNNRFDHSPWPSESLPEYGDFWGTERPFSAITPAYPEGESIMHFRIRVGAFVEELVEKHREETVIVVCHGGVIEITYDHIFNVGPWRRCEVWTKNTGITHFQLVEHPRRETWRLQHHSRTEHYALMPAQRNR